MDEFPNIEYGSDEHLDGLSRDALKSDLRWWWGRATEMEAENAKLRELVRFIMHQCNDGNPRCDECISWNDGECVALQRIRELGVEVDG